MPPPNIARTLRQSGVILIGAALLSAEAAGLHMRQFLQTEGLICGSGASAAAHCAACYASVLLLASGVAAFILAQADRTPACLKARRNPPA